MSYLIDLKIKNSLKILRKEYRRAHLAIKFFYSSKEKRREFNQYDKHERANYRLKKDCLAKSSRSYTDQASATAPEGMITSRISSRAELAFG
jgi:hypothetical protein